MSQTTEASYGNATLKLEEQPSQTSTVTLRRASTDYPTIAKGGRGFAWGDPEAEYIVSLRKWTHGNRAGRTVFGDRATVRSKDMKASFCTIHGDRNDVTLSKDKTKVCRIDGHRNEVRVPSGVQAVLVNTDYNGITLEADENVIVLWGVRNEVKSIEDDEGSENDEDSENDEYSENDEGSENDGGSEKDGGSEDSKNTEGDENEDSKGDVVRVPDDFIPRHLYNHLHVIKLDRPLSDTNMDADLAVAGPGSVVIFKSQKEMKGTQLFVSGSSNQITVKGPNNLILVSGDNWTSRSFEGNPAVGPGNFFAYENKHKLSDASTSEAAFGAREATKYATESSRVELKRLGVEPIIFVQSDLSSAELRHEDYPMTVTVDWFAGTPRTDAAAAEARPEVANRVFEGFVHEVESL